ncbi:MAG: FIST C-terminal domain-containing protein [Candidatus Omnitrophica bacterium]|nr:FIST C-terminal domain-containing protein [Candidatus Omnitrophota bacterium]
MIKAGTHYSKNQPPRQAAEIAAHGALSKAHLNRASTALVFASIDYCQDYPLILERVQKITQARQVVGASAASIITEDAEIEGVPAVGVMVIESDTLEIRAALHRNLQENSFQAGALLGESLRGPTAENRLALLFPDPFSFQGAAFFAGLEQSANFIPLAGGGAADDGNLGKSYQFLGTEAAYDAVSSLGLSGKFQHEMGIVPSCAPFTSALQVTQSDGNKIYELDHRPAYDILLESLSQANLDDTREIGKKVFLGLALKEFQTDFTGTDYFVSKITDINTHKGILTSIVPVRQGGFLTFALRDQTQSAERLRQMLASMHERLAPRKPAFGFYFNCCSRGSSLYSAPNHDVGLIRRQFPGVPILGFNTYGQFAPMNEMNFLNHQTGVLTLIAED